MTIEELIAHKADIQRQARKFMESKGVFEGLPEEERWKHCVSIVFDAWRMLGPQLDELPPNAADHRPRASDARSETETPPRGSVHLLC